MQKRELLDSGNWTPVPNWIFENTEKLDGAKALILQTVVWRTFGTRTVDNRFSIRYLSARTGLNRTTVHKHLRMMIAAGWLLDIGRGASGEYLLAVPEHPPGHPGNQDTAPALEIEQPGIQASNAPEPAENPGHTCPGNQDQYKKFKNTCTRSEPRETTGKFDDALKSYPERIGELVRRSRWSYSGGIPVCDPYGLPGTIVFSLEMCGAAIFRERTKRNNLEHVS